MAGVAHKIEETLHIGALRSILEAMLRVLRSILKAPGLRSILGGPSSNHKEQDKSKGSVIKTNLLVTMKNNFCLVVVNKNK